VTVEFKNGELVFEAKAAKKSSFSDHLAPDSDGRGRQWERARARVLPIFVCGETTQTPPQADNEILL
jgi:hypothetical protein